MLAAVDFVRAPRSKDKRRGTNDAYARIQYLLPVPGGRQLAFNDIRGILYLTDMQGSAPKVYLDLRRHRVGLTTTKPEESGFMGFAFHPEFATPDKPGYGKLYTAFTAARGGTAPDYDHSDDLVDNVVREWTAKDPQSDAFAGTSREVLRVGIRREGHPIGTIAFNSVAGENDEDYGLLYIGLGDGGRDQDSQSIATPLGAIARIDPLGTTDGRRYGIPASNPFVGRANAAPEIYAYGLRHPQQFSWDADGRMFIADIGAGAMEEVNLGIAGGNYGWPFRQGTSVNRRHELDASIQPGPLGRHPSSFTCPVAQYAHTNHPNLSAVGGGFVYRGTIAALRGKYVFTDFVNGRLLVVDAENLRPGVQAPVFEFPLAIEGVETSLVDTSGFCILAGKQPKVNPHRKLPCGGRGLRVDARLGIDHDGELYVLTKGDGWIRKLVGQHNRRGGRLVGQRPAGERMPEGGAVSDTNALWRSDFNGYVRRFSTGGVEGVEGIVLACDQCGRYDRSISAAFVPADRDAHAVTTRTFMLRCCGGGCDVQVPLPAWTLSSVRVGQTPNEGGDWAMDVLLDAGKVVGVLPAPRFCSQPKCLTNPNIARLRSVYERTRTATPIGKKGKKGAFSVYLSGKSIDYVRAPCIPDDLANRFFLHAVPRDTSVLPLARRRHGSENLDFRFWEHGGVLGDACLATVRLPPWPVQELRTGQFNANGDVWRVSLDGESLSTR